MKKIGLRVLRLLARNSNIRLLERLATKIDYSDFERGLPAMQDSVALKAPIADWIAELEQTGICIVQKYWSTDQCSKARSEVDRIIALYPNHLSPHAKSDSRIYGAERVSDTIANFNRDPDLMGVAAAYNREVTAAAFTLAARMPYLKGNGGSGEGWHRDAFLRQFKAIIYLSDAASDNGPFQIIQDSHRSDQILHDMKISNLRYMQNRLEDHQVTRLVEENPDRLRTVTGLAGTLILVDTSNIHRGMPIKAGTRYALTNYYYPVDRIDEGMYKKFNVLD